MLILEKAMAPHSSTLAWKIPWMEEPGRLQSMGSQRVEHDWATSLSLFTFMHWRRKWQPTPVFLPWESQGLVSLVGCHLWGHTESDTTEVTAAAAAAATMLILDSANLCKAWVVYRTQQKSNKKPCFYCSRYQLKHLPNSFNFPDVIFSRNSKHIKFRFRQTFQEDVLTDFRFLSFPFLSFLLPTQPLNSLTALNSLLGHFKSIKLCLSAYISTSLMSHWQGCDFGEM